MPAEGEISYILHLWCTSGYIFIPIYRGYLA